jgi:hypothetical protein
MTVSSNAWKSYYGALAAGQGLNITGVRAYSKMLDLSLSKQGCVLELNQTVDMCAVATQGQGRIHILHQFKYDMSNPMNPDGTNELWTLVGSESHVGTMTVPESAFESVESLVPEWADLGAAVDAKDILALKGSAATITNPKITTRRVKVVPPFIAKALMATGSNSAAELCLWTIKALRDFDTAALGAAPGAAAAAGAPSTAPAPTGITAVSIFREIAYFLWMAATDITPSADLILNMSSVRATSWISTHQLRVFGPSGVPGAVMTAPPGLPPPPTGPTTEALNITLAHLDGTLGKLANESELARTAKEKSKTDTDRALTRFGHLPGWTKTMILTASEEPTGDAALDANGEVLAHRISPVETYTDLLKLTTIGSCKQALDHLLNDVMQCATNIPLSTCQAIHTGTLRWSNADFPQAFSLFACPYAGALHNGAALDQEAQELLLKATEGKGLSDADVHKATKILLYAPRDMDVAARMIGVFACLLQCLFGPKAKQVLAVKSWIPHIRAYQLAYDHLTRGDRLFPTKICWLIDKSIQLHLGQCANASNTSMLVNDSIICFDSAQQQIVLGTFTMIGLPLVLTSQLTPVARPNPTYGSSPSGGKHDRDRQGQHLPARAPKGRSIMNPNQPPAWKITDSREFGYFLRHLRDAPMCWGDGIQACANYWIRGVCSLDCNRLSGHEQMEDCAKTKFGRFVATTRAAYRANPTGP